MNNATELKELMESIRKKLGITGEHINYPEFTYYTDNDGDYWTVTTEDSLEVRSFRERVEVIQFADKFLSLEQVISVIRELNSKLTTDEKIVAANRKREKIASLKEQLKKLEEEDEQ